MRQSTELHGQGQFPPFWQGGGTLTGDKSTCWQRVTFFFLKKDVIYLFLETGREGEREGEKHGRERETSIPFLSYMIQPGTQPETRHVPLPGIQPAMLRFAGRRRQLRSHTGLGRKLNSCILFFIAGSTDLVIRRRSIVFY